MGEQEVEGLGLDRNKMSIFCDITQRPRMMLSFFALGNRKKKTKKTLAVLFDFLIVNFSMHSLHMKIKILSQNCGFHIFGNCI
jgi:hypothetical protein